MAATGRWPTNRWWDDETWAAVRDDPAIQELLQQRRELESHDAAKASRTARAQDDPRVRAAADDLSTIRSVQDGALHRLDAQLLDTILAVKQRLDATERASRQ